MIVSPCISICKTDPVTGYCYGCGRSNEDKKMWKDEKTIAKFEKDELEHHDIGIEHDAENAPGYKIMTKVIEIGCKTAIAISKKI